MISKKKPLGVSPSGSPVNTSSYAAVTTIRSMEPSESTLTQSSIGTGTSRPHDVDVVETYTYGGKAGPVSQRCYGLFTFLEEMHLWSH